MNCKYFGECGSCTLYELTYEEQIKRKQKYLKELFSSLHVENFEVFKSPDTHYRNRAEFRIWHDGDEINYAMNKINKKEIVKIKECPKVVKKIANLMQPLKDEIKKYPILREKLFSIEFLSSSNKVLVSLLYHKKLDNDWGEYAKKLEEKFDIATIGRSRKVKIVTSEDFVIDKLHVEDKTYTYKVIDGGFSQPNSYINTKMIAWALKSIKNPKDLLELYCGHGNFTIPLSFKFNKVLATEISKASIKSAKYSCNINNSNNIEFLRMSVEELTSALKKEREFKRLKDINLDNYDFSHVLVDPPRAGIDKQSLNFISQFKNIIYISCNLETLKRDLEILRDKFKIEKFAMFDQFPHTLHVESGVILKKML